MQKKSVTRFFLPSRKMALPFDGKIILLRVIPTMTFQNSLLTPLLSEAFVTGLLPN
jgi:hypothetical protein